MNCERINNTALAEALVKCTTKIANKLIKERYGCIDYTVTELQVENIIYAYNLLLSEIKQIGTGEKKLCNNTKEQEVELSTPENQKK